MTLNFFAKSLIGAAVLAAAASSAVAANLTKTAVWTGSSSATTFEHLGEFGTSFFDTLNFTIPTSGSLSTSAVSIDLQNWAPTPGMALQITGLQGTVWDNFHPNGIVNYGTFNGNNTTFNVGNLSAGTYHIDFTGNVTGQHGGAYLAALHLAPVPEPETYAMLLAGLGVMGAIARRRKAA